MLYHITTVIQNPNFCLDEFFPIGIASLDTKSCGKIGGIAIAYYITTTALAVILGMILVVTIRPGASVKRSTSDPGKAISVTKLSTLDSILDLFR